jgi:thermostable 8-oxoguanine DNA glycosylase
MVNPENITNYDLNNYDLQERILFWVCAAGKNGRTAAKCCDTFLNAIGTRSFFPPFEAIKKVPKKDLPALLKICGIGCYNAKAKTMWQLAHSNINLSTCEAADLEKIYGIGMKTSRCFLLHSRKNARYAGLDTHILKFLRKEGHDAPKSTPTGKKYLELEKIFLEYADKAGKSPAELDLEIWNEYSVKIKQ